MKTSVWIFAGMVFLAAAAANAANNTASDAATAADSKANVADVNVCANLPDYLQLKRALVAARSAENSGLNTQEWATLVDRNGAVCAVAFTGFDTTTEMGIGRISSAMRANAGNAFAFDSNSSSNGAGFPGGLALSTANLYSATQPGGFVGELPNNFSVNQSAAFSPHLSAFGTPADPMVEQTIGGFTAVGGGLGLFTKGQVAVAGFAPLSGDPNRPDNIVYDIKPNPAAGIGLSSGGLGHPMCPNFAHPATLPAVQQ